MRTELTRYHHAGCSNVYQTKDISTTCSQTHLPQVIGMTAPPGHAAGQAWLQSVQLSMPLLALLVSQIMLVNLNTSAKVQKHISKLKMNEIPKTNSMYFAMEHLGSFIGGIPCLTRGSPKYESWLQNEKSCREKMKQQIFWYSIS